MIQTGFIFRTDQKVYQIYKCSLACWFIASWLVGVADAWYNPIEGRYYTGKLIRSKKPIVEFQTTCPTTTKWLLLRGLLLTLLWKVQKYAFSAVMPTSEYTWTFYRSIRKEPSTNAVATARILQCVAWLSSVNVTFCYYGTKGIWKNRNFHFRTKSYWMFFRPRCS